MDWIAAQLALFHRMDFGRVLKALLLSVQLHASEETTRTQKTGTFGAVCRYFWSQRRNLY
jgi:hypothetical protein